MLFHGFLLSVVAMLRMTLALNAASVNGGVHLIPCSGLAPALRLVARR
jgi:hypothetical protein